MTTVTNEAEVLLVSQTREVPKTKIEAMLISFCETHLPSWFFSHVGVQYPKEKLKHSALAAMYPNGSITLLVENNLSNEEIVQRITFGPENITQGLKVMSEKFPFEFQMLLDEEIIDEYITDIFAQCAIYGDVVYF